MLRDEALLRALAEICETAVERHPGDWKSAEEAIRRELARLPAATRDRLDEVIGRMQAGASPDRLH